MPKDLSSELVIFLDTLISLKVKVKVAQLCLTRCDPMDYTAHGIL